MRGYVDQWTSVTWLPGALPRSADRTHIHVYLQTYERKPNFHLTKTSRLLLGNEELIRVDRKQECMEILRCLEPELMTDVAPMVLYTAFGDSKYVRDLPTREPVAEHCTYFNFRFREVRMTSRQLVQIIWESLKKMFFKLDPADSMFLPRLTVVPFYTGCRSAPDSDFNKLLHIRILMLMNMNLVIKQCLGVRIYNQNLATAENAIPRLGPLRL